MRENARGRAKRTLAFALFLLLLAVVVFAVMQRQLISDQFAASTFDPAPRVVELVSDLELTDAGERIFLATQPTVDGSQNFTEQCSKVDHSEQGHVLGCFTNDRIHLFGVADERVSGIVEVTAAHELLHAAYARLGEGDRAALGARLRTAYEELAAGDDQLRERMLVYEHLSDAAFANELHSVLGTEVRELPDWLEAHYARWFQERDILVSDFDAYHSVFVDLQDQAAVLKDEMTALREDIERRKTEYDRSVVEFNEDAAKALGSVRRSGSSDDADATARADDSLGARRAELDRTLDVLQADIDHYNGLRDQLATLSEVSAELDQNLNSELAPVTTRPSQ